jgi:hypothetical protein
MISVSSEIKNRAELAYLCNDKGLTGYGVEIGTHRGEFAKAFLHRWKGNYLYLVDHYAPTQDFPYIRDLDKNIAYAALSSEEGRVQFIHKPSKIAISEIVNELDFIYIDGGHLYHDIMSDMIVSWDKLRKGGMLAGHDFVPACKDVCRAVKDFSDKYNIQVWITQDLYEDWSWYCYKN